MKPELLIVDDDDEIRTQMKWALASDYTIRQAEDRESAIAAFNKKKPAVTLLDLGLPPNPNTTVEGMATLTELREMDPQAKVIIISGQADKENAIHAVGIGAYDFLCKPVEPEELKLVIQRCVYLAELELEYQKLQTESTVASFEGMVAGSESMTGVFKMIEKVARSTAPVLILGESGTGKEMVSRAVHNQSPRNGKPFIAINCNAIPENLLESELFGHEKGSFTGAEKQRKGLIEGAEGGTLFLDEIGELPAPIQVKLLRFLQEKRIQRVGGREELEIDTRLVAATNAHLKDAIAAGTFREDLYFRLAVVVIELPALRERDEDAIVLAKSFLKTFAEENDRPELSFTPSALIAIGEFHWPGNVRELQNRVQRAVIMANGNKISIQDLELSPEMVPCAPGTTLKAAREDLERDMLKASIHRHEGKIAVIAKELGVSRPTIYEMMERFNLDRP